MSEQKNELKLIKRNENGLIEGIEYKFTNDGLIDWRAMIPAQYLYINNDPKNRERIEKTYGKPYNEIDIIKDKVKDSDLVILLGGLRYIAKLRGTKSVSYNIKEANPEYAAVNCKIVFRGSYETENEDFSYEENACATLSNTNNFAQKYLVEICTNRAFARCVRNASNIFIVSKEELPGNDIVESSSISQSSPKHIKMLEDIMRAKNVKWETIVDKLKKENTWNETYKTVADLPKEILFDFINRLKKIT